MSIVPKKVITSNDTENKSLLLLAKSIGQIIMMAIYELIFYMTDINSTNYLENIVYQKKCFRRKLKNSKL